MMKGSGQDSDYLHANLYREKVLHQDEAWVWQQTNCVDVINRAAFCPGVKLKDVFHFWNIIVPNQYYQGSWDAVTNVFDLDNTMYQDRRLPRLGLLDIRMSGGQYHACFYIM